MSEMETGFRLSEVFDLLRRRAAIVGAFAAVGLVLGYLLFASTPSKYGATARVEVQPVVFDANTGAAAQALDVATEQDLVKSDAVAEAVRKKLGLTIDNRSLFQKVTVGSKENSRVLEITFESGIASSARDGANTVADEYLAARRADAKATKDKKLKAIEPRITAASQAVTAASDALAKTRPGTPERAEAQTTLQQAQQTLNAANADRATIVAVDTESVGQVVRRAPTPSAVLSKKAVGKGVGVFGLLVIAGLGIALLVDRRDSKGGGRRKVEQLLPGVNIRMMPTATNSKAGHAEIDAAIDRLAVDLAGGGSRGRASSVLVVGTRMEPPIALAEELASSLTFAGIPALFVLAGTSERDVPQAQVVSSFTDLITGPSVTGPASLPEVAGGAATTTAPLVTWLRPRGSAEASGLLRRAVVEALVTRAGREGFETVVFVAATPTRNAAAAALGQWVAKTAVIVDGDDSQAVEQAVSALLQADVRITEVVWT